MSARVESNQSIHAGMREVKENGVASGIITTVIFLSLCVSSAAPAAYPEELWHYDLPTPSLNSAAAADIDGDGKLEIVFGTYYNDGTIYALNAEDGSLLWKYKSIAPLDASLAIADVVADNPGPEVLFANSVFGGFRCLSGSDGHLIWSYAPSWQEGTDSPPAVGDIDGDGKPEVVFGSFTGRIYALNAEDGSECWVRKLVNEYINADPGLVDLDGNGKLDIVFPTYYLSDTAANNVIALNGQYGYQMWSYGAPMHCMYHGCAFADLDNDGKPEFVVRDATETLYWIAADGNPYLAPQKLSSTYIGTCTPPVCIGDVNGDQKLEVITFGDTVFCLSNLGKTLWKKPMSITWCGAALADISGDGKLDVVFCSYEGEVIALDGSNGHEIWVFDGPANYGGDFYIIHPPVIADFNGNGKLDVFFVGGKIKEYGRAWALTAGQGSGPGWTNYRHDLYNSGCFEHPYSAVKDEMTAPQEPLVKTASVIDGDLAAISYWMPASSHVSLRIFDSAGRLVAVLVNANRPAGEHRLNWNTHGLNSGVYFCMLETKESTRSAKIVLVR